MSATSPTGHSYKFMTPEQKREGGRVLYIAMQEFERGQRGYSDKQWEMEWDHRSAHDREQFRHAAEALLEWASRQAGGVTMTTTEQEEAPLKQEPLQPPLRRRWEYYCYALEFVDFAARGRDGWELCAVADGLAYFKREVSHG